MRIPGFILLVSVFILTVFLFPAGGEESRVSIAVIPLKSKGVNDILASNISDLIALELSKYKKYKVISQEDVRAILKMNREKIDMGCEDNVVCVAEVGGAMGASKILSGTIGKVGNEFIFTLQLIDIEKIEVEGRAGGRTTDEQSLMDEAVSAVTKLFKKDGVAAEVQRKPILAIMDPELKGGVPKEAAAIFADRIKDETSRIGKYEIMDRNTYQCCPR